MENDMFETLMTLMQNSDMLGKIFEAVASIVFAANIITSMTKTEQDDKVVGFIMRILNFLSMNFGMNLNKK